MSFVGPLPRAVPLTASGIGTDRTTARRPNLSLTSNAAPHYNSVVSVPRARTANSAIGLRERLSPTKDRPSLFFHCLVQALVQAAEGVGASSLSAGVAMEKPAIVNLGSPVRVRSAAL